MSKVKQVLKDANLLDSYWGQIIYKASERGQFYTAENESATNWGTCACGKLNDRILRHLTGKPEDYELYILGVSFGLRVRGDSFLGAAKTLVMIEQRAIEVLADENV